MCPRGSGSAFRARSVPISEEAAPLRKHSLSCHKVAQGKGLHWRTRGARKGKRGLWAVKATPSKKEKKEKEPNLPAFSLIFHLFVHPRTRAPKGHTCGPLQPLSRAQQGTHRRRAWCWGREIAAPRPAVFHWLKPREGKVGVCLQTRVCDRRRVREARSYAAVDGTRRALRGELWPPAPTLFCASLSPKPHNDRDSPSGLRGPRAGILASGLRERVPTATSKRTPTFLPL